MSTPQRPWSSALLREGLEIATVMDYLQFVDDIAADDDPDDDPDDPAPQCTVCGGGVGIFVRFSLNWTHYRATDTGGVELFDPGHEPQVGWRTAPGEPA
ncbi:MAG: hypothetical protein ACRDNW_08350 [Trebonia sp.]